MLREIGFGDLLKEIVLVPKPYPPEFRRRALDLLESGRSVREVAASLGIAESCLHRWRRRDLIDRGLKSLSPTQAESVALAQARARIAELENQVKIWRKAAAAVEQVVPQKSASPWWPSWPFASACGLTWVFVVGDTGIEPVASTVSR
ncbi:transposase [Actinomadura meridiana]|uniref:transposase n=1 Tax=Actinomadura meridiana TaxID=559626 RepID=UPI003CD07E26